MFTLPFRKQKPVDPQLVKARKYAAAAGRKRIEMSNFVRKLLGDDPLRLDVYDDASSRYPTILSCLEAVKSHAHQIQLSRIKIQELQNVHNKEAIVQMELLLNEINVSELDLPKI